MNTHRSSRSALPHSPFNVPVVEEPVPTFELRDHVNHDRYGFGSVIGIEEGIAVLVDFGDQQVRFTAPYRSLEKL
jgi:hypothetical protein